MRVSPGRCFPALARIVEVWAVQRHSFNERYGRIETRVTTSGGRNGEDHRMSEVKVHHQVVRPASCALFAGT